MLDNVVKTPARIGLVSMGTYLSGATFSPDKAHRYLLWRRWDKQKGTVLFIGLNPSTADELRDDPTIRRCIGFAKAWGYGQYVMANLFAYRATIPETLLHIPDPVGPMNDKMIAEAAGNADLVVAAWGVHGGLVPARCTQPRDCQVRDLDLLGDVQIMCLGKTKDGFPKHPLYLKAETQLERYT